MVAALQTKYVFSLAIKGFVGARHPDRVEIDVHQVL
jgi:hypothetical protein